MERVMVFIDGSNLYHALNNSGNRDVDYEYLVNSIVGTNRQLIRVYYYSAPLNQQENPTGYTAQQRFFQALRYLPYWEVKLGRLVRRISGLQEKGVDVLLSIDMVTMGLKDRFDSAILISGDDDISEAVQIVKNEGKHVELAYPRVSGCSQNLKNNCDLFVELKNPEHLKPLNP